MRAAQIMRYLWSGLVPAPHGLCCQEERFISGSLIRAQHPPRRWQSVVPAPVIEPSQRWRREQMALMEAVRRLR